MLPKIIYLYLDASYDYLSIFRCFLRLGCNEDAIEDAQQAVSIASHSIPALETLGYIFAYKLNERKQIF